MLQDLFLLILGFFFLLLGVLIGVAYLTLMERKLLSYIQLRKGPNKLGFMGVLQPFSDAIKLFCKEQTYPFVSNYISYYMSPIFSFFLSILMWVLFPYYFNFISFELGLMFFFSCTSLGVYLTVVLGWSSNSNYSLLGSLRALAQAISYEVSLILLMLSLIMILMSFNLMKLKLYQDKIWFIFMMIPLSLCLISSMMAETNRTPFDFAEGESELVSGFNIEYSSGGFALIFLAEYSSILFMSLLFILMFMGGYYLSFEFYLKMIYLSFLFIWIRGTLPRYRYDKLMYLAWKSYLPLSLNLLLMYLGLKIFIFYIYY